MANSPGDHGEPNYSSPAQTLADLQAAATYAAKVGNRVVVDSYAEMTSGFGTKFGFGPWDGLECFNTDSGDTTVFNESTGAWEDPDQPSGPVTSGVFTPSSGWARGTGTQSMIRLGAHLAFVYASFRRDGAALNLGTDGNPQNVTVGRWAVHPFGEAQSLQSGYTGRLAGYMVDTTGLMQLTAASPGSTVDDGEYLSACGLLII
jgi:hypothetical protein